MQDDIIRFLINCWNDTRFFISIVFAPLKCFTTTLRVRLDIFQRIMSLTIESPSMMVTGSFFLSGVSLSALSFEFCMFSVALLIAFCFTVTFSFFESVLEFPLSDGFSSVSNGQQRFLISIGCITVDRFVFKGDLLA